MKFHPATQILAWCLLVATIQALAPVTLLYATALVVLCALLFSGRKFMQLLHRTRWVMLSLLLIYAYSTPGMPMFTAGPSREGLHEGALQLARLLDALAGLAILLDHLHRLQLIAGLYTLFIPLQWLGVSRVRLAVRLALTLQYAEVELLRGRGHWQEALHKLFGETEDLGSKADDRNLELPLFRLAADALLVTGALLLLWMAYT
jgi:energy-coupling factor transporter transmembrane protein EcfT